MDRTSTYLEHSKSAPLNILAMKLPFLTPIDSGLELDTPRLERVRPMKMSLVPGGTLLSIFNFRSQAPLLQHLEIGGYPSPPPVDSLGGRQPDPAHPPFHGVKMAQPQAIVWRLLSPPPLLQYIYIAISDEEVSSDGIPPHHIHLDSLHYLNMASGVAFSRIIDHSLHPIYPCSPTAHVVDPFKWMLTNGWHQLPF